MAGDGAVVSGSPWMSLSERLAQAEARRASASPPAARVVEDADDEIVVDDATDSGLPAPCPDCDSPGYLEHIDLAARRQHERCRFCGCRWSRPF